MQYSCFFLVVGSTWNSTLPRLMLSCVMAAIARKTRPCCLRSLTRKWCFRIPKTLKRWFTDSCRALMSLFWSHSSMFSQSWEVLRVFTFNPVYPLSASTISPASNLSARPSLNTVISCLAPLFWGKARTDDVRNRTWWMIAARRSLTCVVHESKLYHQNIWRHILHTWVLLP